MLRDLSRKEVCLKKSNDVIQGQVVLEFTFCMIIVLLMLFGVLKVFQWTGKDLAFRRMAHENRLTTETENSYYFDEEFQKGPLIQIDPYFYSPAKMNAVWKM